MIKVNLFLLFVFICFFYSNAQITFSPGGAANNTHPYVIPMSDYKFSATPPTDAASYNRIEWVAVNYDYTCLFTDYGTNYSEYGGITLGTNGNTNLPYTVKVNYSSDIPYLGLDNQLTINYKIFYTNLQGVESVKTGTKSFFLHSINPSMTLSGPTSLLKCSTQTASYTLSNYGAFADKFFWSVPSGFTIISGNNTNSITVSADATASGTISCTVSITPTYKQIFSLPYNKVCTLTISRVDPTISINSPYDICPGIINTASLTGATSGITNVNWSAPANCIITGNGTSATFISTSSSVVLGNIIATAQYGTCTVSATKVIKLHTNSVPPVPNQYAYDLDVIYLCGPNDPNSTVEFTYTGTYPNGIITGSPRTILFHYSNQIVNVIVKFTNPCTGAFTSRTFAIQGPQCTAGKELALPSVIESWINNDENNNKTEESLSSNISIESSIKQITVIPNPSKGKFQIKIPKISESDIWVLKLYDWSGKLIQEIKTNDSNPTIDLSAKPSGIYLLNIDSNNQRFVQKLIKE